jgi:uncharacterized protein (DUF1330 family)
MGYHSEMGPSSEPAGGTPLTLCVVLYPNPGQNEALIEYEDLATSRFADYGAVLKQRVRTTEVRSAADGGTAPLEVQIIEFPSQAALDQFMVDPARVAADGLRRRAIARTDILTVDVIDG